MKGLSYDELFPGRFLKAGILNTRTKGYSQQRANPRRHQMADKKNTKASPAVIVRTHSAGVHYGHLVAQSPDGKKVRLTGARRIWSWKGANTLHEIALRGVGPGSRVSERVDEITLTEAIEVIKCSEAGEAVLEVASWQS